MKILIFGGTRFIGKILVEELLKQGHEVTVATRGKFPIIWDNVKFIAVERLNADSIKSNIPKTEYDVVYDNLVLSSAGVCDVLSCVNCKRYIMISTDGVYKNRHVNIFENEFDAAATPFEYVPYSKEIPYDTRKRFAESALFQDFKKIPAVSVRLPVVLGKDDYTGRLKFYVDKILSGEEFFCDNAAEIRPFVSAEDAGKFLAFLGDKNFNGAVNAASNAISIEKIFNYIEKKFVRRVKLNKNAVAAPFNGVNSYSLNTELAKNLGFTFRNIDDWIFDLVDYYGSDEFGN